VISEGGICDNITAGFDLFSTFASVAGAKIPDDRPIDGRDLFPLMTKNLDGPPPHTDFAGYEARGLHMSYREGIWKLTIPSRAVYSVGALDHYELFRLDIDPGELNDVSAQYPHIKEQMIEKAKAFDKEVKRK
jgi:arylsulfatase A-like enzyme